MSRAPASDLAAFEALCRDAAGAGALGLDPGRPVWIFGAGRFGKELCGVLRDAGFTVRGFIETKPSAGSALGLPLKSWGDFAAGGATDQVALGIFSLGTPFGELRKLALAAGFQDLSMPWDLYAQFGPALGWRYWLSGPEAILQGLPRIKEVHALLEDEESRRCLLRILAFRLGRDTDFGGFTHAGAQYFNDITLPALPAAFSYVDGGAYNGDSFLELAGLRTVTEAYLFEPDPANFRDLVKAVVGKAPGALCLPLGLMDDNRVLSFKADGDGGSAVSEAGTVHVAVAALDQVLAGRRADFIKMDVEGSESQALQGAARLIKASRPVLAISMYHRPDDLWTLPLQVKALCADYRFYLRQHCFNSFDSVLYAVPR